MKGKPIAWGLKWWCRCDSSTGYLYEFDIYVGRKLMPEVGLGEGVVLRFAEALRGTFANLYFDNFFTSPLLIQKLFDMDLYSVGTVRANRKNMPQLSIPQEKSMTRGDVGFIYSDKVVACKWFDSRVVTLLASNVSGADGMSTVLRREKGAAA